MLNQSSNQSNILHTKSILYYKPPTHPPNSQKQLKLNIETQQTKYIKGREWAGKNYFQQN